MAEKKRSSFVTNLAAGVISKGIATLVTFPLDRSVTLLKVQGVNPALGLPSKPYAGGLFGFVDVIRQTNASSLGWRANYRGVTTALVAPALTLPLNFAVKDVVKGQMPKVHPKKDPAAFAAINLASGALAGALTLPLGLAVAWPITRAQADLRPEGARQSGFGHFSHMWRDPKSQARSFSLMAHAIPVSLAGIVVFRGVYFGMHDTLTAWNPYQKQKDLFGLLSKFTVAQLSALTCAAMTYPLSVVTTRYVVANYSAAGGSSIVTLRECASAAMDGHGVRGLYRGYPSQLSTSIASGLVLLLYGELKSLLYKSKPPDERIKRQRAATETEAPRRRRDAARPSPLTMSPVSDEERYGFAPKPSDNVSDGKE